MKQRPILAVLILAVLAFMAAAARAQADTALTLDIKPQKAGSALLQLARKSGVQIMFAEGVGAQVDVDGLKGEYRLEEALAALLNDTGLEYTYAAEELVVVQAVEPAEEPEPADEAPAEDEEAPIELPVQRVTGSRLARGDPSARVYSYSAEELARRGASTLEEFFRTLPWSFPSISTQTNTSRGLLAQDTDVALGQFGLGISTINLRAMGSDNTLVLVNGRRVAGAAGYQEDFVNTLTIPLAAIERVDVQLDGASAVYGSDAIGGVVNIVLRNDYEGASAAATARHEFSSSGSDLRRISLNGNYAWGTGNLTVTASRRSSQPIDNRKTGWDTLDYRDRFGPEYDLRTNSFGQPGVACEFIPRFRFQYLSPRCTSRARYQLPAGHSGLGATVDDFMTEIAPADAVLPSNGEDAANTSFSMRVRQHVTDSLDAYADILHSDHESMQERRTVLQYLVPTGNAYNPFDTPMIVSYWPAAEIEAGLMPRALLDAESRQRNYTVGLLWAVRSQKLDLSVTRSKARRILLNNASNLARWESDPGHAAFYAALESSEPDTAINVFGNGTAQGDVFADLFAREREVHGTTITTSYQAVLRGDLVRIRGGNVEYALGGELRKNVVYSHWQFSGPEGPEIRESAEQTHGVERPAKDYRAYFAELSVPLVGEDNARPGLRSLLLSLQARKDTYEFVGSLGRDTAIVPSQGRIYVPGEGWQDYHGRTREFVGSYNLGESRRGSTSPRVGLRFQPTENLVFRASWSSSFRPPLLRELFGTSTPQEFGTFVVDLHHPSGEPTWQYVQVNSSQFSPRLDSETSDNYSVGFAWSPPNRLGFRWTADWSRVDFANRIEGTLGLLFGEPEERELALQHPDVVRRDAEGYLTAVNWHLINIANKVSETVDTELHLDFDTRVGRFTPSLQYMRVLDESYQISAGSPRIDRKGTGSGSSEYRVTASLGWEVGRFALHTYMHYLPGYENHNTGGSCKEVIGRCTRPYGSLPPLTVRSLTTVDLSVTYEFDNGLRLRVGGRNVLKAEMPTIWRTLPYDPTRWDARGRVLFLELTWET